MTIQPDVRERCLLTAEVALRYDLAAAGVARRDYRRLPTQTELASGALFAAMDDLVDAATVDLARIAARPGAVYERNVRRRIDVVRSDPADLLRAVGGLNRGELGAGYTRSRKVAVEQIAARLRELQDASADAAEEELRGQGVPVGPRAVMEGRGRLLRAYAESIVDEPALRAAQAVERSVRGNPVHPDAVDRALDALSDAVRVDAGTGSRDLLHQLALAAQAAGRAEVLSQAPAGLVQWVASELRDQNTCVDCADVDGTVYDTWDRAVEAYPLTGFVFCKGGLRCRGAIVVVAR